MKNQIRKHIKKRRQTEIMEIQQEIAFEHAKDMIGRKLKVMIEGKIPEENLDEHQVIEKDRGEAFGSPYNIYIGRTYMDAPNVDGYIFVRARGELMSGEFVDAMVTDAKEYDLIGELI